MSPFGGVDCKLHDDPEVYRHVVEFLKNDPLSLGALVTTHKIDLLNACHDLFDTLDSYAVTLGEISSISKNEGSFGAMPRIRLPPGSHSRRSSPKDTGSRVARRFT